MERNVYKFCLSGTNDSGKVNNKHCYLQSFKVSFYLNLEVKSVVFLVDISGYSQERGTERFSLQLIMANISSFFCITSLLRCFVGSTVVAAGLDAFRWRSPTFVTQESQQCQARMSQFAPCTPTRSTCVVHYIAIVTQDFSWTL